MKTFSRLALLALVASLAACSVLESDKIDYKSTGKAPSLDIPPDLTQLSRDNRYAIPGNGTISANAMQAAQTNAPGAPTAVTSVGDVRMERSGSQRWLSVNRPPDKIWDSVRDFWQENGFLLTTDQRDLGIMETDWAENRAKLPQDIIRSTLGKLVDSVYSTGELDRFRTRLERTPSGGTEIYVTHRGMEEVYSNSQKDQTVWQPRAADPALEIEFMRRMMVKLGVSQEQAKAMVAATGTQPAAQRATITSIDGQPAVRINDNFDTAWRVVGLSLDRTGFTVEDRDRSAGTYFVRYVPPDRKAPSTWAKIISFGTAGGDTKPLKLRVVVKGQGSTSTVTVQNEQGAPDSSDNAKKIVQVIADDLK
ncbi:outer membrane protein assembly factor BamC [Variovorax dokdonensis]|uniref:Outer membrane protein assembly factor BamC n=1 Tax=Variovorax dokdonensis TaxID=344883 RepID=A0ABT7NHL5_9BURK|nr:outer membrane protein assembly factor BamC [Variovorax dokdonensis]MDM0047360.1 outer membrane protein assembly factor BamC [Variovorax dokdonensis]